MNQIKFSGTKITDGFWKVKQDMVKNTTAMAVYERFKETHRFDVLKCTWTEGEPNKPDIFWDSDVVKWMEGVSYILTEKQDDTLQAIVEEAIADIIAHRDENGYFNSHFLVTEQDKRFTYRSHHELYCAGHMIEAAVAYYESTGRDAFLKAVCKFADYIEKVFKVEDSAAFVTPGHPELELALVRLYHATNETRYLELAKFFIDKHGDNDKDKTPYAGDTDLYNQDEVPLRERETAEGHCVRALYLLSAAADIAFEYGDADLQRACERCFDNIVNKRMYITGGIGSTRIGETFTVDYHLPNRTAYAETCAAISLAMFCGRMQKLNTDSRYADTVERTIYNGILSGISMDGKSFFYENPLEIDPEFNDVCKSRKEKTGSAERYAITERVEVFGCSCCPPNLVRFIPSIADYMYTYDEDTLYIHQYINSETASQGMEITQTTNYPADSQVRITYCGDKKLVAVRIPGWCRSFTLNHAYEMKNGYAYIQADGETEILLNLDMPVTAITANRRVHDDAGRIAVTRGPIVYCIEGIDNGSDLKSVMISANGTFEICDNDFLLPSLKTTGYRPTVSDALYQPADDTLEEFALRLIPYYAYANRGTTEMQVWLLRKY